MSVKKEANGRRSLTIEVELPGTPEDVWRAIATGPGIAAWFVPAEFEEKGGKPIAMKLKFGPGVEPTSRVTVWDPPKKLVTEAEGWMPGSPTIADEWIIEARAGGKCVLRIVQSLFASTDEWDSQLEGAAGGLSSFLVILRIYLAHFRGQRSALARLMGGGAGTEAETWEALKAALGLTGLKVGQRWTAPTGAPAFDGVVEYLTHDPYDALLRIEKPWPGVVALGIANYPGAPAMVAMHVYLYGDQAAGTVSRETPKWQGWLQQRFPVPAEQRTAE